jgi:hypothetical protein
MKRDADCDSLSKYLVYLIQQIHRRERIPPNRKEIIKDADRHDAQSGSPQFEELSLHVRSRRYHGGTGFRHDTIGSRQRVPVDLAGSEPRKRLERDECRRNHVLRELFTKISTEGS